MEQRSTRRVPEPGERTIVRSYPTAFDPAPGRIVTGLKSLDRR
jgi:hypothetical protein